MVPRNKLSPPREEFLVPDETEIQVQINTKTKAEMRTGRAKIAEAWAVNNTETGLIFLSKRYGNGNFIFEADRIKTSWCTWDIVLDVSERPINPAYEPKLVLSHREPSEVFISQFLLTKIIMVCG